MNKRYCIIVCIITLNLVMQTMLLKAQFKFYEDSFNGGVTAGGYSPGTGTPGNGYFSIHIAPGSSIRKAYLFAGKHGPVSPLTVDLNGTSIAFNTTTALTSFYSVFGGIASVHAVEITSLLNPAVLNYVLNYPGGISSDTYTDFYLYVAYENASMDIVNTAIFANTQGMDSIVPFNMNLTVPVTNAIDAGLSLSLGYICSTFDGEHVFVDGSYLGKLEGPDTNNVNSICGGPMGSFYYENYSLFGMNDDNADLAMDSSDALSNIKSILPLNTSSVNLVFYDDSSALPDNAIWLAVLAYGNSTTGINDITGATELKIFPSPVKDKLNVRINNNDLSEIILYDIASRKLLQQKFTNTVTLNTAQLAKGIYIYEVRNGNGMVRKGKVVKE